MGLENRIEALKNRHHDLESSIETEARRSCPDEIEIHNLKKEKLRIKDEISGLMRH